MKISGFPGDFYKILRKNLWKRDSVCVTIKSAREIFLIGNNENLQQKFDTSFISTKMSFL